jgi:hypothetical protein
MWLWNSNIDVAGTATLGGTLAGRTSLLDLRDNNKVMRGGGPRGGAEGQYLCGISVLETRVPHRYSRL